MSKEEKELIYDEISEQIISIAESMARREGAHVITVRKILEELGATNRVFYNRFHNIDEVLETVYKNAVLKMQVSIESDINPAEDFYGYVMDLGVKVLMATYDIKMEFSRYMFEHDSITDSNRIWWMEKIKKIIRDGKKLGVVTDIDENMLSYSIWCFLRGFNADAVGRRMSKDEAVRNFKFGFGCILNGLKSI